MLLGTYDRVGRRAPLTHFFYPLLLPTSLTQKILLALEGHGARALVAEGRYSVTSWRAPWPRSPGAEPSMRPYAASV
jgi:hypothetical protein